VQLQGSATYSDVRVAGVRFFSPPFLDMGVSTVIRLNSLAYDPAPFHAAGIRCLHIDLGEDSLPSPVALLAFLDAVAAAHGAVAVHCTESLGCTGTLAAAHLKAAHGFSAHEAMGWFCIARPGSVVGHFLCRLGDALHPSTPCAAAAAAAPAPAALRDAVLSLDPPPDAAAPGPRADRRCSSAPQEASRRPRSARIRLRSEI
jgi:hypothetical protein